MKPQSKKRRSGFTLRPTEKITNLLEELSDISGQSKNRLVNHFLALGEPHMIEMIAAFELIKHKEPENYKVNIEEIMRLTNQKINVQTDLIDQTTQG